MMMMVMRSVATGVIVKVITLWGQGSNRPAGGAVSNRLHLMLIAIILTLTIVTHITIVAVTTVVLVMSADSSVAAGGVVLRVVSKEAASLEVQAGKVGTQVQCPGLLAALRRQLHASAEIHPGIPIGLAFG